MRHTQAARQLLAGAGRSVRPQSTATRESILGGFESSVAKTYGRYNIVLSHGKGRECWDVDGKRYLDMGGGIAVNSLGHAHPEIVETVTEQMSKLVHCSNLYFFESQASLGNDLTEQFRQGGAEGKVFFCNSGVEANEGMFKLARACGQDPGGDVENGRYEVITAVNSFHGRSLAAIAATGQDKIKKGFYPMTPGFSHVPFNDLAAAEAAVGPRTAAIMIEGIQGEGGIVPASADYLLGLRKLCDAHGILLMVDAVQCGHFRSGRFQSYERTLEGVAGGLDFSPDAVSMAKSMGAGVPIGAFWARDKFVTKLQAGMHGTTFGGNPLACAVGHKVMEIIKRDELAANAYSVGEYLKDGLTALAGKYPTVLNPPRGMGLMIGLSLKTKDETSAFNTAEGPPSGQMVDRFHTEGLMTVGSGEQIVRLLPPLNTTESEAGECLELIEAGVKAQLAA